MVAVHLLGETAFVDPDGGGWEEALRPETRVVYIEIPVNPTLRILDPRPVVAVAREIATRAAKTGAGAVKALKVLRSRLLERAQEAVVLREPLLVDGLHAGGIVDMGHCRDL